MTTSLICFESQLLKVSCDPAVESAALFEPESKLGTAAACLPSSHSPVFSTFGVCKSLQVIAVKLHICQGSYCCIYRSFAFRLSRACISNVVSGSVISHHTPYCCREQKDKVSGQCAAEIFRRQEDAAGDFRLDKELYAACQVTCADDISVDIVRQHILQSIALPAKLQSVQTSKVFKTACPACSGVIQAAIHSQSDERLAGQALVLPAASQT